MRQLVFLLVISGTCFAVQDKDDAAKKELKLFQGKWEAVSGRDYNGAEQTNVELQLTSLEIDGDKFTMKTGSLTVNGTLSVDPSKKPKAIDLYFGDAKDKPSIRGIYEQKDDVRKSCFAEPGKDRPDRFRAEKGFMMLEWRKVK